jgi:hypothetical protein
MSILRLDKRPVKQVPYALLSVGQSRRLGRRSGDRVEEARGRVKAGNTARGLGLGGRATWLGNRIAHAWCLGSAIAVTDLGWTSNIVVPVRRKTP